MARTSTYLNFERSTEEAFLFYKTIFSTDFVGEISRLGDVPAPEGKSELSEDDKNLVMHVALPILGGHMLMGSDAPESLGLEVKFGNNVYINLEPDTRDETRRLFNALSEGGTIETELQEMFWGGYFGSITDRFGVLWMFNCDSKQ